MFQALFQGIKESVSFHKACPIRKLSFVGRQVPPSLTPCICSPFIRHHPALLQGIMCD